VIFGAHIGISGGLQKAPEEGRKIGCETIQIFSKNQQQWAAPPLDPAVAEEFRREVRRVGYPMTAAHASYLLNLGTPDPKLHERSVEGLVIELQRAEALGLTYVVLHPGAHTGAGVESGLSSIVRGIQKAFDATAGFRVRLLLENAAGQGSTLGSTFEELGSMLEGVGEPARLGLCLDTCHAFAAGWDLRTEKGYRAFVDKIEESVGLERVQFFHLNDAREELGSRVDRHAHIGEGSLGLVAFRRLVNDPLFRHHGGVLETPVENATRTHPYLDYERDLRTLKTLRKRS
jgi:deoxyribonuclease-4